MATSRQKKPQKVLNLFQLGTTSHRHEEDNIFTRLYNQLQNTPNHSHYLLDGIAGIPINSKEHPRIGTYDVKDVTYDPTTGNINVKKEIKSNPFQFQNALVERVAALYEAAFASTYPAAINEIVHVVAAVIEASQQELPIILNLYGFSRGADTLVRALNMLSAMYGPDVFQANIFSMDNVAGPLRKLARRATHIPDNVNEFYAIQKIDEGLSIFDNQDKSRLVIQNSKTKTTFQNYRGQHTDGYLLDKSNPDRPALKKDPVSQLCYDDLVKFYSRHCLAYADKAHAERVLNRLEEQPNLNLETRLDHYTDMLNEKVVYSARGIKGRAFVKRMQDYFIHGTNYFVSTEHMALFSLKYPHAFDYLFQQNQLRSTPGSGQLRTELNAIYKNPALKASLVEAKYLPENILDIQPAGVHIPLKDLLGNIGYEPQGGITYQPTHLMLLWESILKITSPYIGGLKRAKIRGNYKAITHFLDEVYRILTSDYTAQDKIRSIKTKIKLFIENKKDESHLTDQLLLLIENDVDFLKAYTEARIALCKNKLITAANDDGKVIPAIKGCNRLIDEINNYKNISLSKFISKKLDAFSHKLNTLQKEVTAEAKQAVTSARHVLTSFLKSFQPHQSLAAAAIIALTRYTERWNWLRVLDIKEISADKKQLALETIEQLKTLISEGKGDDREEIYKVLRKAQEFSKKLYYFRHDVLKNSPTPKHLTVNDINRRPAMQSHGRLDKILLELLRDMNWNIPTDLYKAAPPALPNPKPHTRTNTRSPRPPLKRARLR